MKKIHKILIWIIWFILIIWLVYASDTVASNRKSNKIPWQWTPNTFYDDAHNVWTSYLPESRFSFDSWTSAWWDSVILDSVTWLMWQSNWTLWWTITWDLANSYCADLELWWYTDWRLPTLKELLSIADLSRYSPSIDTTYFTAHSNYYWSSTTRASITINKWIVNFTYGTNSTSIRTNTFYVRCIR